VLGKSCSNLLGVALTGTIAKQAAVAEGEGGIREWSNGVRIGIVHRVGLVVRVESEGIRAQGCKSGTGMRPEGR
jgi:hypothetical protein